MKNKEAKYQITQYHFTSAVKGIIGMIDEELNFHWAMDIYTEEAEFEGQNVSPKFSFTQLKMTHDFQLDKTFSWEKAKAYDEELEDWVGSFYIFDGHYFECQVHLARLTPLVFQAEIKGRVDVSWATVEREEYKDFEIIDQLPFNGILCEVDDLEKTKAIASKYLSLDDLDWHSVEDHADWEDSWWLPKK